MHVSQRQPTDDCTAETQKEYMASLEKQATWVTERGNVSWLLPEWLIFRHALHDGYSCVTYLELLRSWTLSDFPYLILSMVS